MNELLSSEDIFLNRVDKLWPIIAFLSIIVWKQIITHFDVKVLKEDLAKLESATEGLENEFNSALKDHVIENKVSNEKLTQAITELIKATTILTVKIESLEKIAKS